MTQQGRLQATIAHYRQLLLQRESSAVQALNTAYAQQLAVIQPMLDKIYTAITQKLNAGEEIPPSWIYERLRLEHTQLLIQQQIDNYGALALQHTRMLQHLGAQLGQQSALDLLVASSPIGGVAGLRGTFGVPSADAIAGLVGATQAGSPLADLFAGFGAEAAQGASQALISGVTLGWNPRQIAPQVETALNVPRWRALTIARTEMLRAYRGAAIATYQANSDVCKQWRWTCALQKRTCSACLAMDGTLHDISEDFGSHPNCRCSPTPVTTGWADILGQFGIDTSDIPDSQPSMQSGSDWLDQQDEETQRAILGAKYQGWSDGDFSLQDIVGRSFSPDWGHSVYEKSLAQLTGGR